MAKKKRLSTQAYMEWQYDRLHEEVCSKEDMGVEDIGWLALVYAAQEQANAAISQCRIVAMTLGGLLGGAIGLALSAVVKALLGWG